jgi:hypothetical protein
MEGGLIKDKNLKKINLFILFFIFQRKGETKRDGG